MIDMPYGLNNPEAAEGSGLGGMADSALAVASGGSGGAEKSAAAASRSQVALVFGFSFKGVIYIYIGEMLLVGFWT